MELIPIFKISIILFSIAMVVILTISYIMYRVKNAKKQNELGNRAIEIQQRMAVAQPVLIPVQVSQKEQALQVQQRVMQQERVSMKPRERFQVVNQQQSDLRIFQTEVTLEKPFYHPRQSENKAQFLSRKSFNLFDSYSSGGEKLHKLNLSAG